ncbi:Endonuclease, Uma2 family (restriction endonuclease fold) [Lentibacillus persicus]|uniref:Endonuclease, Uma2 family (Restriction endonuclease fold) n=1 Tax=Lentibacillus persicus TaxID=640948 RepID=A0A1I1YH85_9BACI|nr:Uma2 family endonuclease [Lentibacillus persicus]SFE18692.1 Endonuclease, Uma2 family (restriction endonuclease fold) [Lentibacillus persicus]
MTHKKYPDKAKEPPMTYDQYADLPDDGMRYELADGVLQAISPSPHPVHQLLSQYLSKLLIQSCQNDYITLIAPIDVILSEHEVRQPDLVMIHKTRLKIVTGKGVEGSPDLAVEVLSPSSVKRDRMEKMETYAKYGIAEYWLVDPVQKALEQYTLNGKHYDLKEIYQEDETVTSPRVQCVSFSMNDILSDIPDLPNA